MSCFPGCSEGGVVAAGFRVVLAGGARQPLGRKGTSRAFGRLSRRRGCCRPGVQFGRISLEKRIVEITLLHGNLFRGEKWSFLVFNLQVRRAVPSGCA